MFGSKLYCWSVTLVSFSGSNFITVREADKKYIFCIAYSYFLFKQERKKSAVHFIMHHIFTNIYDPCFRVRPNCSDQLPLTNSMVRKR